MEQARNGLVTVLLTGTGEPTLYPTHINDYLDRMRCRFPLITLQTNGLLLDREKLTTWRDKGLTQVCISVTNDDSDRNNQLMGIEDETFNYWRKVDLIHNVGLSVRLNCTMLLSGLSTPGDAERLINECRRHSVEQLTFREVDQPPFSATAPKVAQYVKHEKPFRAAEILFHHLSMNGASRLPNLPHGGTVFDYKSQNVCVSNCLTDTLDPNDIRQIIFFPTGEISYDWKYKGARIL